MDSVVRGGTVVTAAGATRADVGIREGRVVLVGLDVPRGNEEIDASSLYVFPGGVDAHTHLNIANSGHVRHRADDFLHGTRAAAAGGVTTHCDFAYQVDGGSLAAALQSA